MKHYVYALAVALLVGSCTGPEESPEQVKPRLEDVTANCAGTAPKEDLEVPNNEKSEKITERKRVSFSSPSPE